MPFSLEIMKKLEKIKTYDVKEIEEDAPFEVAGVMNYYKGATLQKALLKYAELGRVSDANILLDREVFIDVQNYAGETPLMVAARFGHIPMMENLLKKGADISVRNNAGMTVLMRATASGKLEAVKFLLKQEGVNIEDKDNYQRTAFKFSVIKSKLEISIELFQQGCQIPQNIASYIPIRTPISARTKIVKILSDFSKIKNNGIPCQDIYQPQEYDPLDISMKPDLTLKELFPIGCSARNTGIDDTSDRYVLTRPLDPEVNAEMMKQATKQTQHHEDIEKLPLSFAVVVETSREEDPNEKSNPGSKKEILVEVNKLSDFELAILEDGPLSEMIANAKTEDRLETALNQKGKSSQLTILEFAIINKKEAAAILILEAIQDSEIFDHILSHNGLHNVNILSLSVINEANLVVSRILEISETRGTLTTVLTHIDGQKLTPFLFAKANNKYEAIEIINKAATKLYLEQQKATEEATVYTSEVNTPTTIITLAEGTNPLRLENGNAAGPASDNSFKLPQGVYFNGGVMAGNIVSRVIKFVDDQVTGNNQDKSFLDYLPSGDDFIKSFIFSVVVSSLPNNIALANKIIIAKAVSDAMISGIDLSPQYAASMLIYVANSLASISAIGFAQQTEFYDNHPFLTGVIATTASDLTKLCYDTAHTAYDYLTGKNSSAALEEDL